jgi:hypothetical protein
MVVDGHIELVGSDERGAIRDIEAASKEAKVPVRIASLRLDDDKTLAVHVEAGPLLKSNPVKYATFLLAIADENDVSQVSRGENAGRTLKYVAVLRDFVTIGSVDKTSEFSRSLSVKIPRDVQHDLRVVAIVQEPDAGRVWGVGSAQLSN